MVTKILTTTLTNTRHILILTPTLHTPTAIVTLQLLTIHMTIQMVDGIQTIVTIIITTMGITTTILTLMDVTGRMDIRCVIK